MWGIKMDNIAGGSVTVSVIDGSGCVERYCRNERTSSYLEKLDVV